MTIEELVDQEMSHKDFESEMLKPDLDEIYHHQALGAHWGIMNGPPYPLDRKLSTGKRLKSAAKGVGDVEKKKTKKSFAEKRKAKKVYKKRVQAAQKARETKAAKAAEAKAKAAEEERKAKEAQDAQDKAEKEAMEREIWRQDVIRRGDIQTAKEHTDMFSTDEVNQIINKYTADQRLSQLVADTTPQTPAEKTKYEKIQEKVDKIQKYAGTVSDIANAAKKVYDAYETVNTILGAPQKKQQEKEKADREARAKNEEAWKKSVIQNRDMDTMMKNKNLFSSSEIKDLLNNVEADEKLAEKISGGKKEESSKQKESGNQQSSKSAEPASKSQQQSSYVQPPKQTQTQSKSDLSSSLMDKVMARAQNAVSEQRSANEQARKDKAYYQQQPSNVLNLMKAELESQNAPVSQIDAINDVLKERQKKSLRGNR